jgi:hypothetical protein
MENIKDINFDFYIYSNFLIDNKIWIEIKNPSDRYSSDGPGGIHVGLYKLAGKFNIPNFLFFDKGKIWKDILNIQDFTIILNWR